MNPSEAVPPSVGWPLAVPAPVVPTKDRRRFFGRLIWGAMLVALVMASVAVSRALGGTAETMYPEGWLLYSILRLRDGHSLYTEYSYEPFIIALYTPLYYWTVAAGSRIAHLDTMETLVLARSVSVFATLAAAATVTWIAHRGGLRRVAALSAGSLFLSSYVVYPWAYATRPDALALALTLVGLAVGVAAQRRTTVVVAAVLLAMAFFAKQSFVVGVAALTLAALQRRQWDRSALLIVTWSGVVVVGVAWLEWSSSGFFLSNAFAPNALPLDPRLAYQRLSAFAQLSLPLIGLAALGWRSSSLSPDTRRVLGWYVVLAAGIASVSIAKIGSNYNYLLETVAALAVLGAHGLTSLTSSNANLPAVPTAPARGSLLLLAGLTCLTASFVLPLRTLAAYGSVPRDATELVEAIKLAPGPVLTQHDSLAVVLAGKTPVLADPFGIGLVATGGRWDASRINAMIERREFALIVLDHPVEDAVIYDGVAWWPPGVREGIEQRYHPVGRLGAQYLYTP